MALHLVFMGVSGVGKSTIGGQVARELGLEFADGDDFHPPANVAKMRRGVPLSDDDRWPWLNALADWARRHEHAGRGTAMACSALRRAYRDVLRQGAPAFFVHLVGDEALLARRMAGRQHFMPVTLLKTQIETLEPLQKDEAGVAIDVARPVHDLIPDVVERFRR